jgi:quinol monooxygenase YgiN
MTLKLAVALLGLLMSAMGMAQPPEKEKVMGVNLVISFNVKPEKLNAFREIMQGVKTGLPTVVGCRGVRVYNSLDNPLVFTLVETWDSKELHAQHIKKVVDSGQWGQIAEHLNAEPTSSYFTEM